MAHSTSQALPFDSPVDAAPRALRLNVAGGPRAPERVRAWLQSAAAWPAELERNLLLLTCELVNNSVIHGRAGEQDVIEIELRSTGGGVRARVSDSGPGFAPGRGLVALARRRARQRLEFAQTMLTIHLLNHEGSPEAADESRVDHLTEHLSWEPDFAHRVVRGAERRGLVHPAAGRLVLTERGRAVAREDEVS